MIVVAVARQIRSPAARAQLEPEPAPRAVRAPRCAALARGIRSPAARQGPGLRRSEPASVCGTARKAAAQAPFACAFRRCADAAADRVPCRGKVLLPSVSMAESPRQTKRPASSVLRHHCRSTCVGAVRGAPRCGRIGFRYGIRPWPCISTSGNACEPHRFHCPSTRTGLGGRFSRARANLGHRGRWKRSTERGPASGVSRRSPRSRPVSWTAFLGKRRCRRSTTPASIATKS